MKKTTMGVVAFVFAAVVGGVMLSTGAGTTSATTVAAKPDYLRAVYDPIHFKPAIDKATNEQCLACHAEVLSDRVRPLSEAGISAKDAKAWYQTVPTYTGEQDTFHRRHMVTDYSKSVMNMQCTTCHQGNDPREEAPGSSATAISQTTKDFTLRKMVNPETTCLKCHGKFPHQLMGLPSDWPQIRKAMGDNCLTCHAAIRTNRHQVNYLNAAQIEKLGASSSDVCYGCHGGRSWFRIAYPYPRHAWEGMAAEVPDWAKDRPTTSEARFVLPSAKK